jgi:hypothetical protein
MTMAFPFGGFNLAGSISNVTRQTSSVFNQFSSGLTQAVNQASNFVSRTSAQIQSNPIVRTASAIAGAVNTVENVFSTLRGGASGVGSALRMVQNATQGVTPGASPIPRAGPTQAIVNTSVSQASYEQSGPELDWRVSLKVPGEIAGSPVLSPLINRTNGRMVFPFNPVIFFQQSANYSTIQPTHTNYAFHAYQGSTVNDITITGEFFVENNSDAEYWVAVVHFLRTMTKSFYGQSANLGNPPLMTRLNGYGKHVLNDIPVLIANFTVDLPSDVDYIPCSVGSEKNYVPTQSTITVTVSPNYARASHSRFSLESFANGSFVGKPEGFV